MSLNPNGAPPGYYYQAGATAYVEDPAGTYSLAGATTPTADPGGTYSAAGASAPTQDPAGTYSTHYALDRLFLDTSVASPLHGVLSFNSATAVANFYGASSFEAALANEFFAGYSGSSATMLFTRYPVAGARAHLAGSDISNLTLNQLQSINGTLSITSQGYAYSASINLSGVQSFSLAAVEIQAALNEFAGRGCHDRKFDRAGIGVFQGIPQWAASEGHLDLVGQHVRRRHHFWTSHSGWDTDQQPNRGNARRRWVV